jgi:hypothetical protein
MRGVNRYAALHEPGHSHSPQHNDCLRCARCHSSRFHLVVVWSFVWSSSGSCLCLGVGVGVGGLGLGLGLGLGPGPGCSPRDL